MGLLTGYYKSGRKSGGYSVRESLISQGVTSEEAIRNHITFINQTLQSNPRFDVTRYRVDANYPNGNPLMG